MSQCLKIVILKPSKYMPDGSVERFRRGFMPNSTMPHIRSMIPCEIDDHKVSATSIDEYVHTDLGYLAELSKGKNEKKLLLLVGVQSHQFHRALDLAALAYANGCMVVIGGPHVMTCDTSMVWGKGISFAQCEAELVMDEILSDAMEGELKPVYGVGLRWQENLDSPVLAPPTQSELSRYIIPMMGVYPARGCPFLCSFCSVTKIAGRRIRSQSLSTTMESLKRAKAAGVKTIMFTSDNFNKYTQAEDLLELMIDEKLGLKFFVQCDTQIFRQEKLVELLARAGCYQMFVGVESFRRETLIAANKKQNRPDAYHHIVKLCQEHGIGSHFSNIIGFPEDTEESVREHLATLQEIGPNWASFYILCPIPGTEQYDTFLEAGLIKETNLDRFDTTSLTWRHPNLSEHRMTELLYECYRRFSTMGHAIKNIWNIATQNGRGSARERVGSLAMSAFVRYCAWRRTHPMSGGIMRAKLDRASELSALRRKAYGFDLAPLPKSLVVDPLERTPNELASARATINITNSLSTI
ncbi:MAG: B12-binding domain-containing radical SAM protein [Pirellula sp.]|jgi:hypothetical protein|nr:B12-binding domain-containing radical SAM protein [Pirellula sp.]